MTSFWSAKGRDSLAGLLRLSRRKRAVATRAELEDFLDRRAAFMVQKCIFEYSRARSGLLSSKLFKEPAFKAAIGEARWRNYPLCLQHAVLMVEHALRPAAGEAASEVREGLAAVAGAVCRRYAAPAGQPPDFWLRAEERITRRIMQAGLAPARAVKDIPRETAKEFFTSLPIHPDLTSFDFELVTNNIRSNLVRAYDDFVAVADVKALVGALSGEATDSRRSG